MAFLSEIDPEVSIVPGVELTPRGTCLPLRIAKNEAVLSGIGGQPLVISGISEAHGERTLARQRADVDRQFGGAR